MKTEEYFEEFIQKSHFGNEYSRGWRGHMNENEEPATIEQLLLRNYAMYNPNSTWDFVMEHYNEIYRDLKRNDSDYNELNFFFSCLSGNTFGKEVVTESEMIKRRERERYLREQTIPELAGMITEYEY